MIIVKGPLKLAEGGGLRMMSAIAAMTTATRAEPGCIRYSLTPDNENPDIIQVYEEWTDQKSLAAHLVADHLIDFQLAMRRTRILEADVHIHYPDGTTKRLINV